MAGQVIIDLASRRVNRTDLLAGRIRNGFTGRSLTDTSSRLEAMSKGDNVSLKFSRDSFAIETPRNFEGQEAWLDTSDIIARLAGYGVTNIRFAQDTQAKDIRLTLSALSSRTPESAKRMLLPRGINIDIQDSTAKMPFTWKEFYKYVSSEAPWRVFLGLMSGGTIASIGYLLSFTHLQEYVLNPFISIPTIIAGILIGGAIGHSISLSDIRSSYESLQTIITADALNGSSYKGISLPAHIQSFLVDSPTITDSKKVSLLDSGAITSPSMILMCVERFPELLSDSDIARHLSANIHMSYSASPATEAHYEPTESWASGPGLKSWVEGTDAVPARFSDDDTRPAINVIRKLPPKRRTAVYSILCEINSDLASEVKFLIPQ